MAVYRWYEEYFESGRPDAGVKYLGVTDSSPVLRDVVYDPFPGPIRRLRVVAIDRYSETEADIVVREVSR